MTLPKARTRIFWESPSKYMQKKKVNVILSSHDISAQNRKYNLKRQQQKSREHFELSIRQKVNNKNA